MWSMQSRGPKTGPDLQKRLDYGVVKIAILQSRSLGSLLEAPPVSASSVAGAHANTRRARAGARFTRHCGLSRGTAQVVGVTCATHSLEKFCRSALLSYPSGARGRARATL